MKKIVFATHNPNKLSEIQDMLSGKYEVLSLTDINCHEDIPETGTTLEENAKIKAKHVFDNYGFDCFADDTGLIVEALNGEPGVYSARYAGPEKSSDDNMNLLLEKLRDKDNRKAYFETVVCLIESGEIKLFRGQAHGTIIPEKNGEGGFGYDPIFLPEGHKETFAQMNKMTKNEVSHRGKAVRSLIEYLDKQ